MFSGKVLVAALSLLVIGGASAQEREVLREWKELKDIDLTGTKMEIVMGTLEVAPGQPLPLHKHPGDEVYYVLEGATIEYPDGRQRVLTAGAAASNARDVPHAGFKVVGDKTLRLLAVYVIDKGKPITELVK